MLDKLKWGLGIVVGLHLVLGLTVTITLLLSSPWVIGPGGLEQWAARVETLDFRWWLVGFSVLSWLPALLVVVVYQIARAAGSEAQRVRGMLHRLLENRVIPVTVNIDHRIPIELDEPLRVPVKIDTKIDLDSAMVVEANVPIRTELPISVDVKTNVLGLGSLTVPIKARVPLDIVVPISGEMQVRAHGVPVRLEEEALIRLPPIEIPLACQVETELNLLSSLQRAEGRLRRNADTPGSNESPLARERKGGTSDG